MGSARRRKSEPIPIIVLIAIAVVLLPLCAEARGSSGGGHGGGAHAGSGHAGHSTGHAATSGHLSSAPSGRVPLAGSGVFRAPFGRGVAVGGTPDLGWHGSFVRSPHTAGHGGHCYYSRHHHKVFAFLFVPLVGFGYAYPTWYDYPYVEEPIDAEADVSEFEPYYTPWMWSEEAQAFLCQYRITPDAWLLVMVYPSQPGIDYFYDPAARRFVGALDSATGEFRHWYGDENGWSEPEPFPDSAPLAP